MLFKRNNNRLPVPIINYLSHKNCYAREAEFFLSNGVAPTDPHVSVQIAQVAMPVLYGYVFEKKHIRNYKTNWNQYARGAGIAIREQASVRMHADPEARCFRREKLPTGTDNKLFRRTRVIMREGRVFFKKRYLPYGSACIGTDCASRDTGTMRIPFQKKIKRKNSHLLPVPVTR
jgi:hypothetical protein